MPYDPLRDEAEIYAADYACSWLKGVFSINSSRKNRRGKK